MPRTFRRFGAVRMPGGRRFGELPIAGLTLDDCDHVMTHLPATTKASATRRHYAQSLKKLIAYSVSPLRLRESTPIPLGWLPKVRIDRAKSWVYPSEDADLMKCRDVPLAHRLLFGFLAREGMRVSEALGLTWADVDLENGFVKLDENKTDDPRSWALGPDVARALAAWKRLRGAKAAKVPAIFPRVLVTEGHIAKRLREGLAAAGVTRQEVIADDPGRARIPLRAHDLRGSFVTLAFACGRSEAWVSDRTGHRSSLMLARYKRSARSAAEVGLGWFAPLDEAIPELLANGQQTGNRGPEASRDVASRSTAHGKTSPSRHGGTKLVRFKIRGSKGREGSNPSGPTYFKIGDACFGWYTPSFPPPGNVRCVSFPQRSSFTSEHATFLVFIFSMKSLTSSHIR